MQQELGIIIAWEIESPETLTDLINNGGLEDTLFQEEKDFSLERCGEELDAVRSSQRQASSH